MTVDRRKARELARDYLSGGDPFGWFEALYVFADRDASVIPWADLRPNPNLVDWLNARGIKGGGKSAIKVGCGLGDDAEELARRGFKVLAFDISQTAIEWCKQRFPDSRVEYRVADLFHSPGSWNHAFDLVVESYTLQVLPPEHRAKAIDRITEYVAPAGTLLVISRGRDVEEDPGSMPWPLTRQELSRFRIIGLEEISFEDYTDKEEPPVRRFRVEYRDLGAKSKFGLKV